MEEEADEPRPVDLHLVGRGLVAVVEQGDQQDDEAEPEGHCEHDADRAFVDDVPGVEQQDQ